MKNTIRLIKFMLGFGGPEKKEAESNMASFVHKANLAKMKIENVGQYQKTTTYYLARSMGILRQMDTYK